MVGSLDFSWATYSWMPGSNCFAGRVGSHGPPSASTPYGPFIIISNYRNIPSDGGDGLWALGNGQCYLVSVLYDYYCIDTTVCTYKGLLRSLPVYPSNLRYSPPRSRHVPQSQSLQHGLRSTLVHHLNFISSVSTRNSRS